MKFSDIKPEKKYYRISNQELRPINGIVKRETSFIRVIEINEYDKSVLASINFTPAQWYLETEYKSWMEAEPLPSNIVNPLS